MARARAATKAARGGIPAVTRSLAGHLVPRGIRIDAVAPGPQCSSYITGEILPVIGGYGH